jgi:hypothetical protein
MRRANGRSCLRPQVKDFKSLCGAASIFCWITFAAIEIVAVRHIRWQFSAVQVDWKNNVTVGLSTPSPRNVEFLLTDF